MLSTQEAVNKNQAPTDGCDESRASEGAVLLTKTSIDATSSSKPLPQIQQQTQKGGFKSVKRRGSLSKTKFQKDHQQVAYVVGLTSKSRASIGSALRKNGARNATEIRMSGESRDL